MSELSTTDDLRPDFPRRPRTLVASLAVVCALVLPLAACGDDAAESGASANTTEVDTRSSDACDLIQPSVLQEIESGLQSVLPGAALEESEAIGRACRQRFSTDEAWVDLTYGAAGQGEFSAVSDVVSTDGVSVSRVELDDRVVDVFADTSDPRGISRWDASLVGAQAIAGG